MTPLAPTGEAAASASRAVSASSSPLRVDAQELARQPVDQEGAGAQAGLDDIASIGDRRLGSERGVEGIALGIASRDHGGAEVDIGAAGSQDLDAGTRALSVAAGREHRRVGRKAGRLRGGFGNGSDERAGSHQRQHLVDRDSRRRENVLRPDQALHVEDAHRVGRGGRGCPAAGEPEAKIAMDLGDIGGAIQEMRLVLTQPDHPVEAGRDVDRLAGDRVDLLGAEARPEPAHLVHRPLVEPDDGRTDRLAVLAEEAEGLALVRDRHARDARRFDLCRELAQRQKCRAPPVFGFLFEIARARLGERDCGTPFSHRRAGPIPGNRLGGCGRGIDSDDKVARHARAQQPERRRTCASVCMDAGILVALARINSKPTKPGGRTNRTLLTLETPQLRYRPS